MAAPSPAHRVGAGPGTSLVSLPLVAIVGAPNVGKSTLFNRLIGRRRAIVTDQPGVTRDRLYDRVDDAPRPFLVVDTGGLMPGEPVPFAREIEAQAEAALAAASVVLFVVDVRAGATAADRELAARLRRRGTPLVLVANKADSEALELVASELSELGLGEPLAVSAEHGRNVELLLERIAERLGPQPAVAALAEGEAAAERPVRVAIVGRPNVGKSSLVNRLLGEPRVIVSDLPGTTRDPVDTALVADGRRYVLIDTAGIRRAGRVRELAERFSVAQARRNIERCDVVVLVVDATEPLAAQDTHVAGLAHEALRPLVVAGNKWDLVEGREQAAAAWKADVERRLRFAPGSPLVLLSALTGQRVLRVLELVDVCHRATGTRIPTPELNRWLEREVAARPGPRGALRLYYATQTSVRPLRFVLFCNDPARVHFSMRRHLENGLRQRFELGPAPVGLEFRGRRPPA